jgi:hypothetical protein
MKFNLVVFSVVFGLLAGGPLEAKQRSIVGKWSAPGGGCARTAGATTITPMGLENDDVTCKFRTVKRVGQSVIWQGTCNDAEGTSEETVTAAEKNGVLTILYSQGNVIENMVRCKR